MSHNERDQKKYFSHTYAAFAPDFERIATSKTFPLSIEIAVTTPSVDEKPFLCQVASTETPTSAVCSVPRSLVTASAMLFSAASLDCLLYQIRWAIICNFWSLAVACSRKQT